jgi:hypothetical protein
MSVDDFPSEDEFKKILTADPAGANLLLGQLIGEVEDPRLRGFAQAMLVMINTSKVLADIVRIDTDDAELQQRLATLSLHVDGELARILANWMKLTGFSDRYAAFMDEGVDL